MVSICLSVYLWLNHAKTTELISMIFCTKMAYLPEIGIKAYFRFDKFFHFKVAFLTFQYNNLGAATVS